MSNLDELIVRGSPESCNAESIDFNKCALPEYSKSYATIIHNLLTAEECAILLQAAETTTDKKWEQAMVNMGGGRQALSIDTRNCGRIIWDDKNLAQALLDRIRPHIPADIITLKDKPHITGKGPVKRQETWQISRLNERLRFLKYKPGNYFRPHVDGSYITPDGDEMSFLTIHLYLNGGEVVGNSESFQSETDTQLPLAGGATRFFSDDMTKFVDVNPKTGSCLVFQHRDMVHSGEDVITGTKYTVRTDVMYRKSRTEIVK